MGFMERLPSSAAAHATSALFLQSNRLLANVAFVDKPTIMTKNYFFSVCHGQPQRTT